MLSRILPEDLRRDEYDMSKKGIESLMAEIARKHPEDYAEISHKIGTLGRNAVYAQGSTVRMRDMEPVINTKQYYDLMDAEVQDLRRQNLSPEEFKNMRAEVYVRYADLLEKDTMKAALKGGNSWAKAVASGARGKGQHLKAIVSTPGVFADAEGNVIPLFVRNSFAQGVRPAEMLAGTYGGRTSVISTKVATAKGGDFGKILVQSAAGTAISTNDCGVENGLDFDGNDASLRGRVLVRDVAGFKAGTPIDKFVQAKLRKVDKPIIARSALTCRAEHGICAKCAGLQSSGKFANIGDSVGITAAQSVSEPVTQMALNCLHEDTHVRMSDFSTKKIKDIQKGEYVLGADNEGNTFPTLVTNTWDQGVQPVQEYSYRAGMTKRLISVTCTEEHKILSNTKKSSCKEEKLNNVLRPLPAGYKCSRLAAVLAAGYKNDSLEDNKYAKLIGVFLGDGIRNTEHQTLRFSCADDKIITDLQAAYPELTFKKAKRSYDWTISGAETPVERDTNGRVVHGLRQPLKVELERLGLRSLYCHNKFIPQEVITSWSNDSVAELIAGFIATDGSIGQSKDGHWFVSFGSTAKHMLLGLKFLLSSRFGVHSSEITRTGKVGDNNYRHDMYAFTVTQLPQIQNMLPVLRRTPGVKAKFTKAIEQADYSHMDKFYRCNRADIVQKGTAHCYDIEVEHGDSLFVLGNGLIVSNSKHTGGAATGKKEFSGFDVINRFVQVPEEFEDAAAITEHDGQVTAIEDAEQGGKYVHVGTDSYYVPAGTDVSVAVGDSVEQGDTLSEGLASAADIVRLKGLGRGRRYYTDRLEKILQDSNVAPDRRNLEIVARGTINHMRAGSPGKDAGYLPDDLLPYNEYERGYKKNKDTQDISPFRARGMYLQEPILHYTVGTRITPQVEKRMTKAEIAVIPASPTKPDVEPEMQRLRTASHGGKDWLASMHTSYLKKQLTDAAAGGYDTNVESNAHFAPRLAYGVGFGDTAEEDGKF